MKWGIGWVLLATACGASETTKLEPPAPAFVPPPCAAAPRPPCVSDDMFVCPGESGYALIAGRADTDGTSTASVTSPEPGALCVQGKLEPNYLEGGSYSELLLAVDRRIDMGDCVTAVLDARARGIATLQFDLDQVPATRMYMNASAIQKSECDDPYECVEGGVCTLLTRDRQELVLLQPGTNTVLLEDFVSNTGQGPLDTTRISNFALRLEPKDQPVDYAFCVSQVRFLDAAGSEVVVAAP